MQDAGSGFLSSVSASAPGSLMLLGEHAVLHGYRALVCAVNRRITVSARPLMEPTVRIQSPLGTCETPIHEPEDYSDFRFVLDALKHYPPEKGGVALDITSDFPSDIGFGSSAAVTVAVHAALMNRPDPHELFRRSLKTIQRIQGCGSGADAAASVFGGLIGYRAAPLEIRRIAKNLSLTAVYSGSKRETKEVIRIVEARRAANPQKYERIFSEMDAGAGDVLNDFSALGTVLIKNQILMERMKLSNDVLDEIVRLFNKAGVPAKISGSGLGDCVIGLGDFPSPGLFQTFPVQVERQGVRMAPR